MQSRLVDTKQEIDKAREKTFEDVLIEGQETFHLAEKFSGEYLLHLSNGIEGVKGAEKSCLESMKIIELTMEKLPTILNKKEIATFAKSCEAEMRKEVKHIALNMDDANMYIALYFVYLTIIQTLMTDAEFPPFISLP